MKVQQYLKDTIGEKNAAFCVLIDPDKAAPENLNGFLEKSKSLGVDALLVGSSILINDSFDQTVKNIQDRSDIPVILFPGSSNQVSSHADAILFMSLISGRNPYLLFGDHVIAAPSIKNCGIEPIATGYILIESGSVSATEFMSNTRPIPRNKPEIVFAHALAASYLGMNTLYLEAGSGANDTVPDEMISLVKNEVPVTLIVGGGIKKPETAAEKVRAGADIVVIGTVLENSWDEQLVSDFARAIHE
ncbi:geranylgeranylglyceryl/heptaprenylglyceryl phosphate synthase [candidate division KSB1 bacterium]